MNTATADEASGKGPRFVKVYKPGWDRIRSLMQMKGGPTVGKLWLWLQDHVGHDNAIVVPVELLARELGVDRRSVSRAAATLQDGGALVIAKLGSSNVYILNPQETFRSYEDHKRFCGFSARAIVGFAENAGLRRRLTHFVPQPELPGVAGDE
jgi:hypothetical protein